MGLCGPFRDDVLLNLSIYKMLSCPYFHCQLIVITVTSNRVGRTLTVSEEQQFEKWHFWNSFLTVQHQLATFQYKSQLYLKKRRKEIKTCNIFVPYQFLNLLLAETSGITRCSLPLADLISTSCLFTGVLLLPPSVPPLPSQDGDDHIHSCNTMAEKTVINVLQT